MTILNVLTSHFLTCFPILVRTFSEVWPKSVMLFKKCSQTCIRTHTHHKHYCCGRFKPHVLKMNKAILFYLCVCLPHSHTYTHFLLTHISSSLNPRLAFRSAGSERLQQLTSPYLQPRSENVRERRYPSL